MCLSKGGGIGAHGLLHVGVFIFTEGGQMRWVLTWSLELMEEC